MIKYSDFVDYSKLNPFKRLALSMFSPTFSHPERLGIKLVEETLGQAAVAFDFIDYDFMIGFNVEGLGTKSLIADEMYAKNKISEKMDCKFYRGLGQDTIAMSINDLISIGAEPFAYGDILSTGDSGYLDDETRIESIIKSFRQGADLSKTALPLGETPTLRDVIYPEAVDLAGASIGLIKPKTNLVTGEKVREGDVILSLESSGIHSNGVTLARKIIEKSKDGYYTKVNEGRTIGELLLTPTHIYAQPISEMLKHELAIHYLSPITGHAFRKIMRPRKPFTYKIRNLPPAPEVYNALFEIAEKNGFTITDTEAYQTWNMGAGFVIITTNEDKDEVKNVSESYDIKCYELGIVESGPKRVIIEPKNIIYEDN